jgi:pyruvate/2-oxoglutarate dehydrogenase complex dihydrolipoamide dehydrogenase (E3) component
MKSKLQIYAGDGTEIFGSQMATPVGIHDGGIAAHNAFADGGPRRVSHSVIPCTISPIRRSRPLA